MMRYYLAWLARSSMNSWKHKSTAVFSWNRTTCCCGIISHDYQPMTAPLQAKSGVTAKQKQPHCKPKSAPTSIHVNVRIPLQSGQNSISVRLFYHWSGLMLSRSLRRLLGLCLLKNTTSHMKKSNHGIAGRRDCRSSSLRIRAIWDRKTTPL